MKNAYGHAYASAYLAYKYSPEDSKLLGILKEIATLDKEINNHSLNGTDIERGKYIAFKDGSRDMWNNMQWIKYAICGIADLKGFGDVSKQIFDNLFSGNDFIIDFNIDERTWNETKNIEDYKNSLYKELLSSIPKSFINILISLEPNYINHLLNAYEKTDLRIKDLILNMPIPNKIKMGIYNTFTQAEKQYHFQPTDPLIIDLDGDGFETVAVSDGIFFDHDLDGFAETSSWVDNDDGVLAIDVNNNGIIDDGSELFGDHFLKSDGTLATSGFDALADFDSNGDGKVSA